MNIYDKDNNILYSVDKFNYHDTFMGENYIDMDIESPVKIPFEIGNYCTYNGDTFVLNYEPAVEKTASSYSRGDAFKYSNLKMNSVADELTRCMFKDVVPSSYNVVWTGLPGFTFYAQTAQNLADRIQANLDATYTGSKKWTITVNTANLVDYNGVLCTQSNNLPIDSMMSISGKTCMEALAEFWNTFKVTYIIRGRNITVAPTGVQIGATLGYGKGNGLYDLQEQTKQDALIVTRLFVYGSTRNISNHYYANLIGDGKTILKNGTTINEIDRLSFTSDSGVITNGTIKLSLNGEQHNIAVTTSLNTSIKVSGYLKQLETSEFTNWTLTENPVYCKVRVNFVMSGSSIVSANNGTFGVFLHGEYNKVDPSSMSFNDAVSFASYFVHNMQSISNTGDNGIAHTWSMDYASGNSYVDFICNDAAPKEDPSISLSFITGLDATATVLEQGALYLDFTSKSTGRCLTPTFLENGTGVNASIYVQSYGAITYAEVQSEGFCYFILDFAYGTKYYKKCVTYNGNIRYVVKFKIGTTIVSGYIELSNNNVIGIVYNTDPNYSTFYNLLSTATTIYITDGLYLDLLDSKYVSYAETISNNLAVNSLMLPDFPFVHNNPNDVYIDSPNIAKYGIREASVTFDGSDSSHPEVYPTIHEMTAKQVIDSGVSLSLDSAEGTDMSLIRLDEIKGGIMPTDSTKNGDIPLSTDSNYNSWQKTFTLYLKDVGFDLTAMMSGGNYYYAMTEKMTISMLSGACTGRTFTINSIKKDTSLGYLRYALLCDRSQDTNINKVYPYDGYPVASGDRFVILNCRLPDIYVKAASQRLLAYGQAYLAKNDSTKKTYIPKVDEQWIAENPSVASLIKAGNIFDFSDTDLQINIKSFIHTLTIKVGDKAIPSYDITLDDNIESTTIQKIQNQLNNVAISSNGGTDLTDVQIAIATYGKNYYVSKLNDDSIAGSISFKKDITVDGKATINELSATAANIGDIQASTGTFGGLLKAAAITAVGAVMAETVSANAMTASVFNGDLNGNAATATRLQTTHKIFGNDFNGTNDVNGLLAAPKGGVFYGQDTFPTTLGAYVLNYVSPTYGARVLAYDGTNYQKLSLGKLISGTTFQLELNTDGTSKFNGGVIASGIESSKGGIFFGQNAVMPTGLGTYVANYVSDTYGARVLAYDGAAYKDLKLGSMPTAGVFGVTLSANGDTNIGYNIGTANFASHTQGWRVSSLGAAEFRNIYADELRVQAFTADISQALAGSDYLTKSVSKLSANFVVPTVNSTVRIIVDDIEGMPATQCFANNDYIRFRAFNRTSGLTIANVWGTVTLDTTFGSNGFNNGTQAYTFTCKATTGAGLTVFKGSEVLDYGTSGSGLISRTTLDAQGSPYEQIATWQSDPSNAANYTVHARLGNLGGIANCSGYGLYTDNGFFTGKIIIGDLTKTANYLSFDTVNGLQIKLGGTSVATTTDIIVPCDNWESGTSYLKNRLVTFNNQTFISTVDTSDCPIVVLADENGDYLVDENGNYITPTDENGNITYNPSWKAYSSSEALEQDVSKFKKEASATFEILNDEINSKVSSATYDMLGRRVGTAESTITQHSTDIASKVAQTDFDALGTRVGTAESNITQNAYAIATKVSQTTFDALGTRVSTAESTITQHTTDIGLKVSKDGIIGAINLTSETATIAASKINLVGAVTISAIDKSSVTPVALGAATPTDVTTAVNGIQVGGRNLFGGTQYLSGSSFNGNILPGATITTNDYLNFTSVSNIYSTIAGEDLDMLAWNNEITPSQSTPYTLSFYAKSTINGDILISYFYPDYNGQGGDGYTENILTTTWKKYVIKWTTGANITGKKNIIVGRLTTGKGTGTVSVCGVKFEEGNKDTTWTPAPEDVDASINGIQIGGRNLARLSKGDFTYSLRDIFSYTGTMCAAYWVENKSTNIVVSGDVEYSNIVFTGTGSPTLYLQGPQDIGGWNGGIYFSLLDKISQGDGKFHFSFNKSVPNILNNNRWDFGFLSSYMTGTITFKNLKVEYGTKETSWSPAPEDVDTSIVTAQQAAQTYALNRNNTMAVKLGYTDYNAMASAAALGHTLIDGGMINTVLINATAVVTSGLTANCITANMISSDAVTADKIAANTITADKIAANTITADKIAANTITADKIAANTITGDNINANSVSAAIATVISLDANRITTGTLSADRIAANSITFNKLVGTDITAVGNVQAGSFNLGNGKFVVDANGNLTATGATLSGNISATSGSIGGWTIGAYAFTATYPSQGQITVNRTDGSVVINYGSDTLMEISANEPINGNTTLNGLLLNGGTSGTNALYINGRSGKAIMSYGNVSLISRSTEGTVINGLCEAGVSATSNGTLGSGSLAYNSSFMPNLIKCRNTTDITITIPTGSHDGQILDFWGLMGGNTHVVCAGSDRFILRQHWNNDYQTYCDVGPGWHVHMQYDGTYGIWMCYCVNT